MVWLMGYGDWGMGHGIWALYPDGVQTNMPHAIWAAVRNKTKRNSGLCGWHM